eukprot:388790-Pleurochrysis_carterae.AAC.1
MSTSPTAESGASRSSEHAKGAYSQTSEILTRILTGLVLLFVRLAKMEAPETSNQARCRMSFRPYK